MQKLTYRYVKSIVEKEHYKLLSTCYVGAHDKLVLQCPKGHVFKLTWNSWTKGRRCPKKNQVSYSQIKNDIMKCGYILLTSKKKYKKVKQKLLVKCPKGHVYKVSYAHWKTGSRCSKCFFNAQKLTIEFISQKLNDEGYVLLSTQYKNANSKLKALCNKNHKFNFTYNSWRSGSRCPICGNKLKKTKLKLSYKFIKQQIESQNYSLLSSTYNNAFDKLLVKCPKGHKYMVCWNDWQQGNRCPHCSKVNSMGEQSLANFIEDLGFSILRNDRSLIAPKELDIVIPSRKIAIEYCGVYWHSELFKNKQYHIDKLNNCLKKGYKLITIFADEWYLKNDIVKFNLKCILNRQSYPKIYDKNCEIREISLQVKNKFLNKYHLFGLDISDIYLGAFYNEVLISVMTFSREKDNKGYKNILNDVWELSRFCTNTKHVTIGVSSLLLQYFLKNYKWDSIVSYADRRWSVGEVHEGLGFNLKSIVDTNYYYSKDGLKRINRFGLSEIKAKYKGYYKIWDCGSLKYIVNKR